MRAPSARRRSRPTGMPRQQGAAIITALLVVTLAAVLVSGLFYRENVAIRSVENRAALAQTRWVERVAVDYARIALAADLRLTTIDHLGEPWATAVPETRLDETTTGGSTVTDASRPAFLVGQVLDAQARFNVTNLVDASGRPSPAHLEAFRRVLANLGLPERLADLALLRIQKSRDALIDGQMVPATLPPLIRLSDLIDVPGFDESTLAKLRLHAVVLPEPAKVNLHTASAEVVAAMLGVPVAQGKSFVRMREQKPFDKVDLAIGAISSIDSNSVVKIKDLVSVSTDYFIITGLIRYDRIESLTETLLHRSGGQAAASVKVVWQHRN